jgi:hypothetical protein
MTYSVGIDQGVNHKKLKQLQDAGVVLLYQAHDLEQRFKKVTQQGRSFRLDASGLGGLDGLADDKWQDTLRMFGAKRAADAEHIYACHLNRIEYFLTEDRTDFIAGGRREQLEALLGIKIRTTEEFLCELREHGVEVN